MITTIMVHTNLNHRRRRDTHLNNHSAYENALPMCFKPFSTLGSKFANLRRELGTNNLSVARDNEK